MEAFAYLIHSVGGHEHPGWGVTGLPRIGDQRTETGFGGSADVRIGQDDIR